MNPADLSIQVIPTLSLPIYSSTSNLNLIPPWHIIPIIRASFPTFSYDCFDFVRCYPFGRNIYKLKPSASNHLQSDLLNH